MQSFVQIKKNIPTRTKSKEPQLLQATPESKGTKDAFELLLKQKGSTKKRKVGEANPLTAISFNKKVKESIGDSPLVSGLKAIVKANKEHALVDIENEAKFDEISDQFQDPEGNKENVEAGENPTVKVNTTIDEIKVVPPAVETLENDAKVVKSTLNSFPKETESESRSGTDMRPPKLLNPGPKVFEAPKTAVDPAYLRFKHLVISKTQLTLPPSYESLYRNFNALESILSYMTSKDIACIFHKIQKSVQAQSGRNFSLDDLGRMLTILPEAYKLTGVYCVINDKRISTVTIELKQEWKELNMDQKVNENVDHAPKLLQMKSVGKDVDGFAMVEKYVKQIPIRRVDFRNALLKRVLKYHENYLTENQIEYKFDKIAPKWHPSFNLSEVPEIEVTPLPLKTSTTLLSKLKDKEVGPCSNSVANVDANPTKEVDPVPTVDANGKPLSRAKALLERIRQKERIRTIEAQKGPDPAKIARRSMLQKLVPLASSLLMYTKSCKKTVVPLEMAINHLKQSFPDFYLRDDEYKQHLTLLAEIAPECCKLEYLIGNNGKPTDQQLLKFLSPRIKLITDAVQEHLK